MSLPANPSMPICRATLPEPKRTDYTVTVPFSHTTIKELLPFFTAKAEELCSVLRANVADSPDQPIESMLHVCSSTNWC